MSYHADPRDKPLWGSFPRFLHQQQVTTRATEMASASPRETATAHHGKKPKIPGEEGEEKGRPSTQGRASRSF